MNVYILYTENHRLLSLAAIVDVFDSVNSYLSEDGHALKFHLQLIGINESSQTPFKHIPYASLEQSEIEEGIIIVPAFKDQNIQEHLKKNAVFIPWLIRAYQDGLRVASCCTGTFLLAAAGILNGKKATTHVEACDALQSIFPEVELLPHAILTVEHHLYTSGGATSTFHMLIFLIQELTSKEYGIRLAKNFAIDLDRQTQLHFEKFTPSLSKEDKLVRQVQETIHQRYSELKHVEEALDQIPSSRRNMVRRFKNATGMTPIRYMQKIKIEAAKHLLETTDRDILDIMLSSGYQDLKSFRELFKNLTGLTPKAYREKYFLSSPASML
jgi:transcriptional regulator GlxA family with amidase domain